MGAVGADRLLDYDSGQRDLYYDGETIRFGFADHACIETSISKLEMAEICGYYVQDFPDLDEILIEGADIQDWWPRTDEAMTALQHRLKTNPKQVRLCIGAEACFRHVWPVAKTCTVLGVKIVVEV